MIDRILRALVTLAGLAAVVLTIVVGGFDNGHDQIAEITRDVEDYRQADRLLQREIVNTRIGLSLSYDRMNAATVDAHRATGRLVASVRDDPALLAVTERLQNRVDARAREVERYKTANALLQNALARFASLSAGSLRIPEVGMLSSAILRLAIENNTIAIQQARHVLRAADTHGRLPPVVAAQVRLLTALLPTVRRQLVVLRVTRPEDDLARIDGLIAQRTRALRDRQSSIYLALLASVLTASFGTVLLVARGVDRIRRLRRRSAGERLSGTVARLLLSADGLAFGEHLSMALERIAVHADTPLVFLALSTDDEDQFLSWPERPADELVAFERLIAVTHHSVKWRDDALICPWFLGPSGSDQLLLLRQGDAITAVLGILLTPGAKAVDSDVMTAARLALAAVIQAAARDAAEVERIDLERQLSEAERMKAIGVIASGVAHNFNNIVAAIGGFAELARRRVRTGSSVAGHLEEITSAVGRARALVDDILGYAGSKAAQTERLKLGDLLTETMRLLRASYGEDAAVALDIAADPEVVGNSSRLQQVFMNICNNAEATAPGDACIGIGLRVERLVRPRQFSHAKLPTGSYAVVTISDNGPGIPAAILPRMFEPFFTTRPSGTGLGLSTAWQIVAGHGGTIEVVSGPGGSRFDIWLPTAGEAPDAALQGHGERVLLLIADTRAGDYEERIAGLGYEPVFLPYAALETDFHSAVASVDAVVAIDPPPSAAAFLDEHATPDLPAASIRLDGDRIVDLATVLRGLRTRPADPPNLADSSDWSI